MTVRNISGRSGLMACASLLMFSSYAQAQVSDDVVKVGLLMDMAGAYSEVAGKGSVTAAQMAVEDFGGEVLGKKIEVVFADMQNKVDLATSQAREWFDRGSVDAIMDINMSAAGLAVSEIAKQKDKIVVINIAGSPRFTNEACNENTVHYVFDTYSNVTSTAKAVLDGGDDSWFFVTVDYSIGDDMEKDARAIIADKGGKVLGSVRVPLAAMDYSSAITQALASKAKVVAFATAGTDTSNAIKQATEFGIGSNGQKAVAFVAYINEVHALGLDKAKDMYLTSAFYWDMDEETREFSKRYFERMQRMPNMSQAGVYSSTMHYLKSVAAAGTDDTKTVMKKMKETPINDFFVKNGKIREDGRMIRDMYLFQVKSPEESAYPWDYYKLVKTVPGEEAFMTPEKSLCPLIKKQ